MEVMTTLGKSQWHHHTRGGNGGNNTLLLTTEHGGNKRCNNGGLEVVRMSAADKRWQHSNDGDSDIY